MTHTLHRFGTPGDLSRDYVVYAMSAKGINEVGSAEKLRRFMEICFRFNPNNYGDMKTGNMLSHSREAILEGIQDVSIVHAVFTDEQVVAAVLSAVLALVGLTFAARGAMAQGFAVYEHDACLMGRAGTGVVAPAVRGSQRLNAPSESVDTL